MTVQEQLRQAYVESGMTMVKIARLSGVSENTIGNIFRGRNATYANLFAVAKVLNIEAIQINEPQ